MGSVESRDLLPGSLRSMRGYQDPASPQRIISPMTYVVEYGIRHFSTLCASLIAAPIVTIELLQLLRKWGRYVTLCPNTTEVH